MATNVKKQIADVFIKKSRQIGMDKVTISMIVSECGISRQAFYYYFQDILDVARYVMREGLKITY
nr:TetR/AcrR family transcriptional regulator [Lachnospiraceae bacterium]